MLQTLLIMCLLHKSVNEWMFNLSPIGYIVIGAMNKEQRRMCLCGLGSGNSVSKGLDARRMLLFKN